MDAPHGVLPVSSTPNASISGTPVRQGSHKGKLRPGPKKPALKAQLGSKVESLPQDQKSQLGRDAAASSIRARSKALCESTRFCVLTTVLTLYALFGDDFRLAVTPQRTDIIFNCLNIICMLVFAVELVAASLGQEEYFLGFFFWLDFGSTVTLFFDLTWVNDSLFCGGSDEGGTALKASRAGRAGARASRAVRIIRLMRLVKLYKAYRASRDSGDAGAGAGAKGPGDSAELGSGESDEEELDSGGLMTPTASAASMQEEEQERQETRVGKKLSDMTTRRVIILVLVMLLVMPYFTPSNHGLTDFRSSANLAAEIVYSRWRSWCGSNGSQVPWCFGDAVQQEANGRQAQRRLFEDALLAFLHRHHNGDFAWRLYWLGINSTGAVLDAYGQAEAARRLANLGPLNQQGFLGPGTTAPEQVSETWGHRFANAQWQTPGVPLPDSVQQRLLQPWLQRCSHYTGVWVQAAIEENIPEGGCSLDVLRCSEVERLHAFGRSDEEARDVDFLFAFDMRGTKQLEATLSLLQTLFICFAVGIGAMTFSKDANELLLNPIERMIAKMETIKDNPLEAMRLGDLEYRREEIEHAKRKEQLAGMGTCWRLIYKYRYFRKMKEPMETVMLEKTIIKLGGLLALGFGEAGADIVGQNMRGGASAGLNAMAPGQKADTIIGFCRFRHFAEVTEVLREKVMLFINQVGEIVHGCVDDYHGAPNKNLGSAFLLIWRLVAHSPERQHKLADMSMMSLVKIIAQIQKSRDLAVYRSHPGLLQHLPDFRVEMGFGLHRGWAIECAIGSEFKIDAAYLSPNVNVAARLEAASTQFGVRMLISHSMIELCTPGMAHECRLIDHVVVKGSCLPLRLYTIDLDIEPLRVQFARPERITKNRFKIRQLREVRRNEKWSDDYTVHEAFSTDEDLLAMRAKFSREFFQRFAMGYRNYEAGEWKAARDMLLTCHYLPKSDAGRYVVSNRSDWPSDGPTVTLLQFMDASLYRAPKDWRGYHELSEP